MKIIREIVLLFFLISLSILSKLSFGNNQGLINESDTLNTSLDSAKYYNNLGVDYWYTADYDKAEVYLLKALRIKNQIYQSNPQKIASTYLNMGLLYTETWRFDQALDYYAKAEKIYLSENKSVINEISAYYISIWVSLYTRMGDYQKAINYTNKALSIIKSQIQNASITYEIAG